MNIKVVSIINGLLTFLEFKKTLPQGLSIDKLKAPNLNIA